MVGGETPNVGKPILDSAPVGFVLKDVPVLG
jgi:hypothetical protein